MNAEPVVKIIRNPKAKGNKRKLVLRVTFNRDWRTYATTAEELLTEGEFNNTNLKITKTALASAEDCKRKAEAIIKELGEDFTFGDFVTLYKERVFKKVPTKPKNDISSLFTSYFEEHSNRAPSTQESYETTKRWILAYKPKCAVKDLTPKFIDGLEEFIKQEHKKVQEEKNKTSKIEVPIKEMSVNTIGIYFRNLKSICNYAVKQGLLKENPLNGYSFKSASREKKALTIDDFKAIKNYQTSDGKKQFARDFFVLSFLMSGINLGDIFALRNMDINDKHLSFERKKTGIKVEMELTQDAIVIIQRCGRINRNRPNDYVFPFYAGLADDNKIRQRKHWLIKKTNKGLEEICSELKIEKVTTYNARHTYATMGRDYGNLDISQLQKFLGHASITTTQIYMDSLTKKAQEKNQEFLNEVMNGKENEDK